MAAGKTKFFDFFGIKKTTFHNAQIQDTSMRMEHDMTKYVQVASTSNSKNKVANLA